MRFLNGKPRGSRPGSSAACPRTAAAARVQWHRRRRCSHARRRQRVLALAMLLLLPAATRAQSPSTPPSPPSPSPTPPLPLLSPPPPPPPSLNIIVDAGGFLHFGKPQARGVGICGVFEDAVKVVAKLLFERFPVPFAFTEVQRAKVERLCEFQVSTEDAPARYLARIKIPPPS